MPKSKYSVLDPGTVPDRPLTTSTTRSAQSPQAESKDASAFGTEDLLKLDAADSPA